MIETIILLVSSLGLFAGLDYTPQEIQTDLAVIAMFESLGYDVQLIEYYQGYGEVVFPEDKILYLTPIRSGIDPYGFTWYEHGFLHHYLGAWH